MKDYTVGDWTVSSSYKDSSSTLKKIEIPDLTFHTDYALVKDGETEAVITNITGPSVESFEKVRYGGIDVKNVYANKGINGANVFVQQNGRQVMIELRESYSATNAKLGETVALPTTARIVLQIPTNQLVRTDMVADLLFRLFACAFESTKTDDTRIMHMIRGALVPSGLQ